LYDTEQILAVREDGALMQVKGLLACKPKFMRSKKGRMALNQSRSYRWVVNNLRLAGASLNQAGEIMLQHEAEIG